MFIEISDPKSSIGLRYLEWWKRHEVLPDSAVLSLHFQAIMQEALMEKSLLVILRNRLGDADLSTIFDVILGVHFFEVDATNVICKSPCAFNHELLSSLTPIFNSKLRVADFAFRKDIVWDLIQVGLNCQILTLRNCVFKKLEVVGKFMQLHTLNLDFCSSLVILEEEYFASMPRLRPLSLCGISVSGLEKTRTVLSRLPSLVELRFRYFLSEKDTRLCPVLINERRYISFDKIGEQIISHHVFTGTDESLQLSLSDGSFPTHEVQSVFQGTSDDKIDKVPSSVPSSDELENLEIEVFKVHSDVQEKDESPTSVRQWDSTDSEMGISKHPSTMDSEKHYTENMNASMFHLQTEDILPVKEADRKVAKTIFSKYYDFLPYRHQYKKSIVSILHMREAGTSGKYSRNNLRTRPISSCRKSPSFYTRSLCATKFESPLQPLLLPMINDTQRTEEGKRFRPRQFEYHLSDSSLMAVGTLDGEVLILNPETGNISTHFSSNWNNDSILGLCWLKQNPSKLLVGTDNGCLRLYDINCLQQRDEYSVGNSSSMVIFEDFEQLTSVHVNSTDDRFLASGYSKKVALYDICSGRRLQLFTDMHREPINVAKFANHSPDLMVTSSFDRDVKMWDLRQEPTKPCYTSRSSRGNVMVCFSPDDLYLLVSSVDNEVKQLLAVDGGLHTNFEIASTGSYNNYTRSYYMNGRDHIISGSCEEPVVRVCCAQTGKLLRTIYVEDGRLGSSIFVQSLRSDPFRHFHMAVLAAYVRPRRYWEIVKVNLLSSSQAAEEYP